MNLTKNEWLVMKILWRTGKASAREVSDALPDGIDWAYTTVKTTLDRLAGKGVLEVEKERNVGFYRPLLSARSARIKALKDVAQDAFDGAFGPLLHFLVKEKGLSQDERKKLLDLLDDEKNP